jgi:hypothetical protein
VRNPDAPGPGYETVVGVPRWRAPLVIPGEPYAAGDAVGLRALTDAIELAVAANANDGTGCISFGDERAWANEATCVQDLHPQFLYLQRSTCLLPLS